MRVSLNWIKKYIDLPSDLTGEQIAYDLTIKKVENGIDYKDKKGKSVVIEVEDNGNTFSLIPIEDFTVSSQLASLPKKKKLPFLEDVDKSISGKSLGNAVW